MNVILLCFFLVTDETSQDFSGTVRLYPYYVEIFYIYGIEVRKIWRIIHQRKIKSLMGFFFLSEQIFISSEPSCYELFIIRKEFIVWLKEDIILLFLFKTFLNILWHHIDNILSKMLTIYNSMEYDSWNFGKRDMKLCLMNTTATCNNQSENTLYGITILRYDNMIWHWRVLDTGFSLPINVKK